MNEIRLFMSQPRNTRILLLTTLLYSFVLPVIDIFVAAYIMRNSSDVGRVVAYQLMVYSGIPVTFLINGFLLKVVKPNILYAFGMLLSGISMLVMTSLPTLDFLGIAVAGFIMGLSFGFFWANRDFLVLICTTDSNRNYYYGLETFFNTVTLVIVPVCIGWFIEKSESLRWVDSVNEAYHYVIYCVIAITVIASFIINRGAYQVTGNSRFVYFRNDPLWNRMLVVAACKGMVQGFIVTAPAMLIMKFVGEEGALGTMQSISALVTAILMYFMGKLTKPSDRTKIYFVSTFLFFAGSMIDSVFMNATAVIIFLLMMIVARPMFDLAYFPIQMQVIDYLKAKENRSGYSYIFSHECGLYGGRLFGCGLFIVITYTISETAALIYTLPIVTFIQMMSLVMVRRITGKIASEDVIQNNTITNEAV